MNKAYTRIDWENYPSINTPINESNLNKMDAALDELDNRVISLDTSKATKTEVATLVADVSFVESTGIITVTKKNGSVITIDTKMEKIAVNFDYNSDTQQIILTLIDGTKKYIDLSALITQYEFLNSDTITFVVQADGKIKAEVLDGSITESKLQPNYLAQIKVETAKSQIYMNNAIQSATQAKSYAVGGTGTRENEDIDNAMYYYEQAKKTDIGQISLKVDEINSNLNELGNAIDGLNSDSYWEQGTWNALGHKYDTPTIIRTKEKLILPIDYSVSLVNSNYVYEVDYYENGKYKNDTDWISGLTIIPKGQEFVLLIRKVDNSSLVPTERNAISVLPKNIGTINDKLKNDLDGLPTFNNIDSVSVASNGSLSITVNGSTYTFYPDVATG